MGDTIAFDVGNADIDVIKNQAEPAGELIEGEQEPKRGSSGQLQTAIKTETHVDRSSHLK